MEEKDWLPKVPLELSGRHETGIIMTHDRLALRNKMISQGTLPKADTWGGTFADQGPRTELPRKGLQKTQRGSRLGRAQESSMLYLTFVFPREHFVKGKGHGVDLARELQAAFLTLAAQ